MKIKKYHLLRISGFLIVAMILVSIVFLYIKRQTVANASNLGEFLYACKIAPCFRYKGETYYYIPDHGKQESELMDNWAPAATILTALAAQEDVAEDLQANYSEMVGGTIWESRNDPDWLYLHHVGELCLFVSERCKVSWIYFEDSLYIHEAHYSQFTDKQTENHDGGGSDSTVLPEGYTSIGMIQFETEYRVPTKNLHTNSADILGYETFGDPQQREDIYVAIPNGVSTQAGIVATRYDRYIKVEDKGTVSTPPS